MNLNDGYNFGKEVLLKDIKMDTFFVNNTLQHFMVKENGTGKLFIKDIKNKKYYPSTEHSDTDECIICSENYRKFAIECEMELHKIARSKEVPDSAFYAKHNINAAPVRGSAWFTSRATIYGERDNVQYIIECSSVGADADKGVQDTIGCYNIITDHYHQQISEVVKYLQQNKELGEIWVLISGHTVYHQIFIGNSTGYLASMWFGAKHPVQTVDCKVEWDYNNKYFEQFSTELNIKVNYAG